MATEGAAVGAVLVVGLTMTAVCGWPMYKGWQRRGRYELVRDTLTATPATATPGDTVLVTGAARSTERVTGPVSGDEGVLAAWSIREWQDESTQLKYWSPEARGVRHAALRVEGDDGAVSVPARESEGATGIATSMVGYDAVTGFDIDDALIEVAEFEAVSEVPQAEEPPAHLRELERSVGLDEPAAGVTLVDLGRTHGTRRYREALLDEGESVTVRGTVTDDGRLRPPDEGPAILSTLDADALARRYRWNYWKLFYGAICVVVLVTLFAAAAIAA